MSIERDGSIALGYTNRTVPNVRKLRLVLRKPLDALKHIRMGT